MFLTGMGTFGADGGPVESPFESPEGLCGALLVRLALLEPFGDAGRLTIPLFMIGTLDGRSMGMVKLRKSVGTLRVSLP